MNVPGPSPATPTVDEIAAAIAGAQAEIGEAVQRGGLHRDPYRYVLGALQTVLGIFPDVVRAMDAARHPLTDAERQQLTADVLGAVGQGMRREAAGVRAAVSRKSMVILGLGMGALAFASGVAGYVVGRTVTQDQVAVAQAGLRMDLEQARAWLDIIRANPDPRPAWQRATVRADANGRRYREGVSLWDEMPSSAPAGR